MLKGEVHPNMDISHIIVFGALRQMVKIRGACDKLFWIYMRLNNCAAPVPGSGSVLVVEEEVFLCVGHAMAATTKTQLFNRLYIQNGLSHTPRTFTIRLSALTTTRYEVFIFG